MGDLKLPPANSLPKVSSLIQNQGAQKAAAVPAQPAAQTPAAAPGRPADQVISQSLQAGQASQSLSFVDTPARPSDAEINWAKSLDAKINAGYKPTADDAKAYTRIADQLEASLPVPKLKPLELPVSERESQWAANLETKVRQGQKPLPEELAAYQNIAYRMLKADQASVPHAGVSRQELDWAVNLQKRVTEIGYKPNDAEIKLYSDIYQRQNAPAAAGKVAKEDLDWAKQLGDKIQQQNYHPTPAEEDRYNKIYTASQTPGSESVSPEEVSWSVELSHKQAQGYQPSEQELDRYGDITRRLNLQDPSSIRPEDRVVSQHELDWAAQLQQQVQKGVPATDEEQKRYEKIYKRYQ